MNRTSPSMSSPRQPEGHAFYGSNDLAGDVSKATDDGEIYYTLSYSSTNKNYDGKLRHIKVELAKQGYHLAYRRQYYADVEAAPDPVDAAAAKLLKLAGAAPPPDTLFAYIRHGAPMSHDLLFSAHVVPVGQPALATVEQMADLADEPAFFRKRHRNKQPQPLPPVPLQSYQIEFDIPSKQFRAQPLTRDLEQDSVELAVAAYNADGRTAQRQNWQRNLDNPGAAKVLPRDPADRRSHHRHVDIPGSPRRGQRKNWQC